MRFKTTLVLTGKPIDMKFYEDTSPLTFNGEQMKVVSRRTEKLKKNDQNIKPCRQSPFALLPSLENLCLLCLGLSTLPIQPTQIKTVSIFK